jgi:hypothetical protein
MIAAFFLFFCVNPTFWWSDETLEKEFDPRTLAQRHRQAIHVVENFALLSTPAPEDSTRREIALEIVYEFGLIAFDLNSRTQRFWEYRYKRLYLRY